MGSKNVETLKGLIDAFNARKDLDAIAKAYGDQAVLVDHARNETLKGRAAVKENWGMWATAFPDGKIEDVRFIDGGDTVAMHFVGHGKNDGTLRAQLRSDLHRAFHRSGVSGNHRLLGGIQIRGRANLALRGPVAGIQHQRRRDCPAVGTSCMNPD